MLLSRFFIVHICSLVSFLPVRATLQCLRLPFFSREPSQLCKGRTSPSEELRFRSWVFLNLKLVILKSKRGHEANFLGGRVASTVRMVGLGGLAEKPGCFTAAVCVLGMCCCFWDVDGQQDGRGDKVQKPPPLIWRYWTKNILLPSAPTASLLMAAILFPSCCCFPWSPRISWTLLLVPGGKECRAWLASLPLQWQAESFLGNKQNCTLRD